MGDFIYFTEEQKERANAVHIADILRREHEEVERSGNEWRWKRHRSVTFRGAVGIATADRLEVMPLILCRSSLGCPTRRR